MNKIITSFKLVRVREVKPLAFEKVTVKSLLFIRGVVSFRIEDQKFHESQVTFPSCFHLR